jgi:hypothetical protein
MSRINTLDPAKIYSDLQKPKYLIVPGNEVFGERGRKDLPFDTFTVSRLFLFQLTGNSSGQDTS